MAEESAFGARVDGDAIYALLLRVDKKVDRIESAVATTQDTVEDHEQRLRSVEAHGSLQAQAATAELVRTRERLHKIEGTQGQLTGAVVENAQAIKDVALSVKSTTSTLMKVSLLLL